MVTFDQIGIGVLADAGGQVAVAAAALVVVLTIVIVFVMVLRSNGAARTASGLGFDAQQGALGQPQNNPDAGPWSRPIGQQGQGQGAPAWGPQADAAQTPWGAPPDFAEQRGGAQPARGGWAGPDAGDAWGQPAQGGNAQWGAPAQPATKGGWEAPQVAPSRPAAPAWGEAPAAGGAQAQAPWGAAPQGPASNPSWGAGEQQAPAWGAPAQPAPVSGGWGGPAEPAAPAAGGWGAAPQGPASNPGWGAPASGQASNPGWGAPAQPQAGGWGTPPAGQMPNAAPTAPSGFDAAGFAEGDRTRVARPTTGGPRTGVIVVRQGKEPGRIFEVRKDRLTIGRSRDSDIFLEDLAVSRLHTTVARDDQGRYIIRDENSANGTYVNSQRVSEQPLEEGDEIQVGQTVLAFMRR